MRSAYATGVEDAFLTFGIRQASELLSRPLPEGAGRSAADTFARAVKGLEDPDTNVQQPDPNTVHRRLHRPTIWGPKTVPEAANTRETHPGLGAYKGV